MQYYAFIDGEQKGPFELDQLLKAGVRPTTYVWCKGMDDWQQALEVPDVCKMLRNHFADKKHPSQPAPEVAMPQEPRQAPEVQQEQQTPPQERPSLRRLPPVEDNPDLSQPPQVSLTLAILSMLLCFVPTGIAAVILTYKSQKTWMQALQLKGEDGEQMRRQAHEYGRQAKMWMGITISLGFILFGFLFSQNFR